jgi:hypothetical protein
VGGGVPSAGAGCSASFSAIQRSIAAMARESAAHALRRPAADAQRLRKQLRA